MNNLFISFQRFVEAIAEKAAEEALKKAGAISEKAPEKVEEKGKQISGIRGGAAYLGCSPSKMQDLKNKGLVPYYRIGKKVYFYACELDNALKGR